jgi:hypothetical protein
MLANARPRHFVRTDSEVKEEELADMTKDIVHVSGPLSADTVMPIQGKPLNDIYVQVVLNKIEELKETTGNRDVSTGGTTSGVTAGAAIAAMQEAGSKLSRDSNKGSYRAFRKVVLKVIERIRQFYDQPRVFRILGEDGAAEYVEYSNAGIKPQDQGSVMGVDTGYRVPLFDVEVTAQKASPYSRMSQNELALQFYGAGFFNPQMADQALACLDMMDFDRKQAIMQKISKNGGMYQQILHMQQQMLYLAQIVDSLKGTNMAQQIAAGVTGVPAPPAATGDTKLSAESQEAPTVKKARQQAAEATSPT